MEPKRYIPVEVKNQNLLDFKFQMLNLGVSSYWDSVASGQLGWQLAG
jgi:hypothetical protein